MTDDLCLQVVLIVCSLVCLAWLGHRHLHPPSHTAVITSRIQRLQKPRTPEDCPACRQPQAVPTRVPPTSPPISPYSERKNAGDGIGKISFDFKNSGTFNITGTP